MKIIQIKGANGSGKSTIPLQLVAQSQEVSYIDSPKLTVLDDLEWVLVGHYKLDAGPTSNGCDNIGKVALVKDAILQAMAHRPTFNVLFEGMMISTIKSTFYDFLLSLAETNPTIQPMFVILMADPDRCVQRLDARGTKRTGLKYNNIVSKCDMVIRHAKTYDQQYVRWMTVDIIARERMLCTFLREVDEMPEREYPSYMDLVKMPIDDVISEIMSKGYGRTYGYQKKDLLNLDQLQLRRLLMKETLEQLEYDRSDIIPEPGTDPILFAPWHIRNTDYPPVYERGVGYRSSSKHDMSLLVMVHQMARDEVPLMTDYEQVIVCGDCKGAGGACPGLSPRFDVIKPSQKWLYVVTVSMDYCWALEFANLRSWYMLSGFIDMITVSYINRLTNALADSTEEYMIGAHNCPGKCKDCVALRTGKCGRKKRRFSMEALGIDCDALHLEFYGEWMPWAYKGTSLAPTYMTRYAGWLSDTKMRPNTLAALMDPLLEADKSYIKPGKGSSGYDPLLHEAVASQYAECLVEMEIPGGVHKGCRMWAYDFTMVEEA